MGGDGQEALDGGAVGGVRVAEDIGEAPGGGGLALDVADEGEAPEAGACAGEDDEGGVVVVFHPRGDKLAEADAAPLDLRGGDAVVEEADAEAVGGRHVAEEETLDAGGCLRRRDGHALRRGLDGGGPEEVVEENLPGGEVEGRLEEVAERFSCVGHGVKVSLAMRVRSSARTRGALSVTAA